MIHNSYFSSKNDSSLRLLSTIGRRCAALMHWWLKNRFDLNFPSKRRYFNSKIIFFIGSLFGILVIYFPWPQAPKQVQTIVLHSFSPYPLNGVHVFFYTYVFYLSHHCLLLNLKPVSTSISNPNGASFPSPLQIRKMLIYQHDKSFSWNAFPQLLFILTIGSSWALSMQCCLVAHFMVVDKCFSVEYQFSHKCVRFYG